MNFSYVPGTLVALAQGAHRLACIPVGVATASLGLRVLRWHPGERPRRGHPPWASEALALRPRGPLKGCHPHLGVDRLELESVFHT